MSISAKLSPTGVASGIQPPGSRAWLSSGRFAAVLALVLASTFAPVLTGVRALAYGDAGQFAYPVAFYFRQSFWGGELPFWNPLNSCGVPFLAQWNTLVLYPPSLIYLLLPLPWSFGFFDLAHLFFAGLGMYFLARRWTGHSLGAAVAGLAFALNGLTWYGLMWPHILAGLAWTPWVVLSVERAWREGKQQILVAVLASAMQLLSGGAEVILQTWILLGVFWLAQLVRGEACRFRLLTRGLTVGLLAVGVAAVQLLPFFDLLIHSQRSAGYSSSGVGTIAPLPLSGWANYLVPLFHCARNWAGVYMQTGQTWVASYYLGIGIIGLALLGAWRVRSATVYLLLGLSIGGLWLAFGRRGLLYDLLTKILPFLGFVRFPVKFVMLPTFCLPLLAGFGLAWGLSAASAGRERKKVMLLLPGLAVLILGILAVAWKFPAPGEERWVTTLNAAVRLLFLLLITGAVALLHRSELQIRAWLLQLGLLLLLWCDIFTHTPNLGPSVPPSALAPGAIRNFFQWDGELRPGGSRAMQGPDALMRMVSSGVADPQDDLNGRRLALLLNLNLLDDVPKFDGFYSMDLKPYLDIFSRVYFSTNQSPGLKDFLGISRVTNPTNLVDWVRRDSFLPLITGGQRPVFADDEKTLGAILGPEFEPRRVVYLPLEAQGRIHAREPSRVEVQPWRFSPHQIVVPVQSDTGGLVVIAQSFYHCWRAEVDGRPVPLRRANYAFQAVEVPAGRHELTLRYRDWAFRWGTAVTGVSLLLCCAGWVRWRGRIGQALPTAPRG